MSRWVSILIGLLISTTAVGQSDYWQQEVDYKIDVLMDDSSHYLQGQESVNYLNNSPDSLPFIIFHLWPNAYQNKETALAKQLVRSGETKMAFASADELGFIDSLAFTLDGLPCVWKYDAVHIDICTLFLEKPLPPDQSLKIETTFRVKIPSGKFSRLGHIGQSYQITQWYPKPAVYDAKGWHPMPYLNQGEFYSEFGSFDVSITLPANYVVGATGDLQTKAEIAFLDDKYSKTSDWLADRESKKDWSSVNDDLSFPKSDTSLKTIRFTQDNVHDFAWFADKRYHVLKGEVELPQSGETVTLWTMFTNKRARLWMESIEYMHDAVYYYSLWNGDYPYHQATAVDGTISAGGGMEYPNVTVIGDAQSSFLLETVIVHEVGHNWFYGILGSNERDYPWLDEGMNSYNELRYLNTKYPNGKMIVGTRDAPILNRFGLNKYRPGSLHYLTYLLSARSNTDQNLLIKSQEYSSLNYGAIVYSKSAVIMDYLRAYLGDEKMDEVMHAYFEAFKFKHPYPEDFRAIAEDVSGENLDWFFDRLVGTTAKLDYKIVRAKSKDDRTHVKLKNNGNVSGPISIDFISENEHRHMWVSGFSSDTTFTIDKRYSRVEIDSAWRVPEIRRSNNYSRTSGLLKRLEPLKISMLGSLEDPRETQLHFLPIVGINNPNGVMPGLAVYNSLLPVKRLNFIVAPMFATKPVGPVGYAEAYYMITPEQSSFESIDIGIQAKRYGYLFGINRPSLFYNRIEPYVKLNFRKPRPSGLWDHDLTLSSVIVAEESFRINDPQAKNASTNVFNRMSYTIRNAHPIYLTKLTWNGEQFEDFIRTSIELTNDLNIAEKITLGSRLFFGFFLDNQSTDPRYNYRMDGQRGLFDYAYDATLLDRTGNDAILGRQLTNTHGGFKTLNATGQSNAGLASYNLTLKPNKIPFGIFGDVGYTLEGDVLYDGGVYFSLANDLFSVYAPLAFSSNIVSENTANGRTLVDLIRFQIAFNRINLIELRRQLDL